MSICTGLLPRHEELIRASAISPEVAKARGYRSVTKKSQLKTLGFSDYQCIVPALLIPIFNTRGEVALYQARPDTPRISEGKSLKYETIAGSRLTVDVPPKVREQLRNPGIPLSITEGVRKADAGVSQGMCCIDILGVWGWRGSNKEGGKLALPDWEDVAFNERTVYIVFDSDVMTKLQVYTALTRLKGFLEARHAKVLVIYLPSGTPEEKVGLDDFLASGKTVQDLMALASPTLRPIPINASENSVLSTWPYREHEGGLYLLKGAEDGDAEGKKLANFTARIIGDISEDDGAEVHRTFEIEARLRDKMARCQVSASEFNAMIWPLEHLGPRAVVFPPLSNRDHARAAIQLYSGNIPTRKVYAHIGWAKLNEDYGYLHAGGAIGPSGPISDVEVRLSGVLEGFNLPDPPSGSELREAVLASIEMLGIAPDEVTIPLFAAAYRAPIGNTDFAIYLSGPTGAGKTELAALVQQHWGGGLDARHLPGAWSSTGNALEGLAFQAKDAVLVVDDFAPGGSQQEMGKMHRDADRVLRAQGNTAGRLRMRSDATLRPPKPPRGLIVSTGEDVPRGQSLRGRLLTIEIDKWTVDWNAVTACQEKAASDLYARSMSGFLKWIANRYTLIRKNLRSDIAELRQTGLQNAAHKRAPMITASLTLGIRYFAQFAADAGAFSARQAEQFQLRGRSALAKAAAAQVFQQTSSEPAARFIELLGAAITSGKAHVADPNGGNPEVPQAWGWRLLSFGAGENEAAEWRSSGDRVGWIDQNDLYLDSEAAYTAAQKMAKEGGEPLPVGLQTLRKRLHERRLLLSTDPAREVLTVRRILEARRRDVLHLQAEVLGFSVLPTKPDHPDQPDRGRTDELAVPSEISTSTRNPTGATGCNPSDPVELVGLAGKAGTATVGSQRVTLCLRGPGSVCWTCKEGRFWRSVYGQIVCSSCHPPSDQKLVAAWMDTNHQVQDMEFNEGEP